MKLSGVRPSVCLSVRPAQQAWITTVTLFLSTGFVAVGPAGRQDTCISIDCCTAGAQQQTRAVSRCQLA